MKIFKFPPNGSDYYFRKYLRMIRARLATVYKKRAPPNESIFLRPWMLDFIGYFMYVCCSCFTTRQHAYVSVILVLNAQFNVFWLYTYFYLMATVQGKYVWTWLLYYFRWSNFTLLWTFLFFHTGRKTFKIILKPSLILLMFKINNGFIFKLITFL